MESETKQVQFYSLKIFDKKPNCNIIYDSDDKFYFYTVQYQRACKRLDRIYEFIKFLPDIHKRKDGEKIYMKRTLSSQGYPCIVIISQSMRVLKEIEESCNKARKCFDFPNFFTVYKSLPFFNSRNHDGGNFSEYRYGWKDE